MRLRIREAVPRQVGRYGCISLERCAVQVENGCRHGEGITGIGAGKYHTLAACILKSAGLKRGSPIGCGVMVYSQSGAIVLDKALTQREIATVLADGFSESGHLDPAERGGLAADDALR